MSGVVLPSGKVISEAEYVERLEDACEQSRNVIEFLHGCLTDDRFTYAYPDQTTAHLSDLDALLERPSYCFHSGFVEGCESCEDGLERRRKRAGWS